MVHLRHICNQHENVDDIAIAIQTSSFSEFKNQLDFDLRILEKYLKIGIYSRILRKL